MEIGTAIEAIRKKKGISQGELADKATITQSYLSLVENNVKEPKIKTLRKIAKALDLPLAILSFLSLTENDVAEDKREIFKGFMPHIKDMVEKNFVG